MRRGKLLASGQLALLCAGCTVWPDERVLRERQWAAEVLLGSESGIERGFVVRWREPVHYLVVGAHERQRASTDRAFVELQTALAKHHCLQLSYVRRGDVRIGRQGYVTIWFTAPRRAGRLVRRYGAQRPPADADGWFTVSWDGRRELRRGVVFIDPDLAERWLVHTVLEEMMQVLGAANDSGLLERSVVYESETGSGCAQQLGEADARLLRLLYGQLQPGDTAAVLAETLARSWH